MVQRRKGNIIYSTDPNFQLCERCGKYPCVCPPAVVAPPPSKQTARIHRERQRRKGKTVTVISGLQLAPADLGSLAKTLKTLCGAGGTVKDGQIEIQGDQRDQVAAKLAEIGYKVKFVGG